eukprot:5262059-Prymnesium_polylepis.1
MTSSGYDGSWLGVDAHSDVAFHSHAPVTITGGGSGGGSGGGGGGGGILGGGGDDGGGGGDGRMPHAHGHRLAWYV